MLLTWTLCPYGGACQSQDCRLLHCIALVGSPALSRFGDRPQKKNWDHSRCMARGTWLYLISGWPPQQHCHSNSTQSYLSSGYPTGCRPPPWAGVPSLLYAPFLRTLTRESKTTFQMTRMHHNPMILMHLTSAPLQSSFEQGWQAWLHRSSLPGRDPTIVSWTWIFCWVECDLNFLLSWMWWCNSTATMETFSLGMSTHLYHLASML